MNYYDVEVYINFTHGVPKDSFLKCSLRFVFSFYQVEYLLSEWVRHFHQPGLLREGDKIYAAYVARVSNLLCVHVALCVAELCTYCIAGNIGGN